MSISVKLPEHITPLRPNDIETPVLTSWSFSALQTYEQCPYRTFLQRVKKIPEPSSPAADRGSKIHDLAEQYVDGTYTDDTIPADLKKFELEFKLLREAYPLGKIILEQEWGFDSEWKSGDWKMPNIWLRSKLDVFIKESETNAIIIDHKTGKKFGNELKHNSQLMLYAICAFQRYPELEHVSAKLWYLDKGETTDQSYTREQAMYFFTKWNARALAMTNALAFPPTPSKSACKWCSYGKPNDEGEIVCEDVFTEL